MFERVLAIAVALVAAAGFSFATVSTSDFVAHLDRQVHGIHCSFLPGGGTPDMSGSSGCAVTLMSPYSSVLREHVWGGVPVSLPAMSVFAFLGFFALALVLTGRTQDRRATCFLALGTALPLLTSIGMGWIAFTELDAACKLCIGIYVSSALAFGLAVTLFARALDARTLAVPREVALPPERLGPPPRIAPRSKQLGGVPRIHHPADTLPARPSSIEVADTLDDSASLDLDPSAPSHLSNGTLELDLPPRRLATASELDARHPAARPARATVSTEMPVTWLAAAFGVGVAFVTVPVLAYAGFAPDFSGYVGSCGTLATPDDPDGVLVPVGSQDRRVTAVEVLDPLCPACRGFERRFTALPAAEEVSRRVLLFPLDSACNWMVDRPVHAGACAVSEAVLCAEGDAHEVIAWAFEEQESIRAAAEADPQAASRLVRARFPALASCLGGSRVRARLNRALRWAVQNQLPVLTPQLYLDGTRICDADTDLGLDYTVARLLERSGGVR